MGDPPHQSRGHDASPLMESQRKNDYQGKYNDHAQQIKANRRNLNQSYLR